MKDSTISPAGVEATSCQYFVSSIDCVAPAHPVGVVDVEVGVQQAGLRKLRREKRARAARREGESAPAERLAIGRGECHAFPITRESLLEAIAFAILPNDPQDHTARIFKRENIQ